MEIKLQSFIVKVEENDNLDIFSNKRENKLEKIYTKNQSFYDYILGTISSLQYIGDNNKSIITSTDLNYIENERLLGSFYYGEHGISNRRKYNIDNSEKENIAKNESIQDRFIYFIKKFKEKSTSYVIIFIEHRENKIYSTLLKQYFKEKFDLVLEKFIEKDIFDYFLKNVVVGLEYVQKKKKIINNKFIELDDEFNTVEIKEEKVLVKLEADLTANQKKKLQSEYFRSNLEDTDYINVKFNRRNVKISKEAINMKDYFFYEEIEGEVYDLNGQLYVDKIEKILEKEYEYIRRSIVLGDTEWK